MEYHRSAVIYWDMIPRDRKAVSPSQTHASSISPVHHLLQNSGSSWELEKSMFTVDSHGYPACMVWEEKR